jgi:hypothetical protein
MGSKSLLVIDLVRGFFCEISRQRCAGKYLGDWFVIFFEIFSLEVEVVLSFLDDKFPLH